MGLPEYERVDLMEMLDWLRERTPRTSYFQQPVTRPEYGVLSSWGIGAYISTLGQRPTVATNFGWETHGLHESTAFMSGVDPEAVDRIAAANNVRYVVMSHNEDLERSHAIAGQGRFGKHNGGTAAAGFNPLQSVYVQLYYHDGASYQLPGGVRRAMGAYRLVYESKNGVAVAGLGMLSYYKVFERVPGVRFRVKAPRGTPVELSLSLVGRNGRTLLYHDQVETDASGAAELVVPYSTEEPSGDFTPFGGYAVSVGKNKMTVKITDNEIRQGVVVPLTDWFVYWQ
jgi:dolichyl-diphosphooligosaccharide--protein glycosyltransferase